MLNLKESRNEGENYVFQIAQKLNEMKKKSLMKLNIWGHSYKKSTIYDEKTLERKLMICNQKT